MTDSTDSRVSQQETPHWRIQLFGTLTVRDAAGNQPPITHFRTQRSAALLAYLAFYSQQTHTRETLAEMLWPEEPDPVVARSRLRQELATLRRQLEVGPNASTGSVIQTTGRERIGICPGAIRTDIEEFERLVRNAARLEGTPLATSLQQAISLHGASGLLSDRFEPWIVGERERLAAHYATCLRRLSERAVAKNADSLTPETLWPAVEPASAFSERTAPGVPLPQTLTRFFGRTQETAALSALVTADSPARLITLTGAGGSGKTRLAIEWARGLTQTRHSDIRIAGFVPLVAITDAARLTETVAVALFPQLREAGAESMTVEQLAERLQQTANASPSASERCHVIVLLDNFEQIADTGAAWIQRLLDLAPSLICIVTSRQRLRLEGEREFPVDPLPLPDSELAPTLASITEAPSAALFADRAAIARPDFRITPRNAADVSAVCHLLDGIPLALEIAAARIAQFAPSRMRAELANDRLDLLISRRRGVEERHQTLRATIAWSVDLLSADTHRFFCLLSVFHDGWTLEAAAAILDNGDISQTARRLQELCDRSLVAHSPDPLTGETRYRMLETLRTYAAESCPPEEMAEAQTRHIHYYLEFAEAIAQRMEQDSHKGAWLDRLEADHENLKAAAQRTGAAPDAATLALRFVSSLHEFWLVRHHFAFTIPWFDAAFPDGPEEIKCSEEIRRDAFHKIARIYYMFYYNAMGARYTLECERLCHKANDLWNLTEVRSLYVFLIAHRGEFYPGEWRDNLTGNLARARQCGNRSIEASCLCTLGQSACAEGRPEEGHPLLLQSLEILEELNSLERVAILQNEIGYYALRRSEYAYGTQMLEHAAQICRANNFIYLSHVLWSLGVAYHIQGRYEEAERAQLEGLTKRRRIGGIEIGIYIALFSLAHLRTSLRQFPEALFLYQECLHIRQKSQEPEAHLSVYPQLAWMHLYASEIARAATLFREARNHFEPTADKAMLAQIYAGQGRIATLRRHWAEAHRLLHLALDYRCQGLERRSVVVCLELYALLLTAERADDRRAVILLSAAAAERNRLGAPVYPVEQESLEKATATLQRRLGSAEYALAAHEGASLSLDAASNLVLV